MKFINQIHIKYFRSIYNVKFNDISETVTVFTGKNDTGKSNILRALNLFFNGETDVSEKVLFDRDFSKIRKQEIKERSKERQLISIAIEFKSPLGFRSLPRTFWATRTIDRYNKVYDYTFDSSINKGNQASATRFLNSIEYTYIPAIKDKDTFAQVLNKLKANLPSLGMDELIKFNTEIKKYGAELRDDLQKNIGLSPYISLPSTIQELFSSLDFSIEDGIVSTSLSQRGDGVRCRFLPAIMNYIAASNSSKKHIWGLEEPENSLEFRKVMELNNTLSLEYSKNAQILITSHSPAFVGTFEKNSKKIIYMLSRQENGKISHRKFSKDFFDVENTAQIGEELGYIELQKDLANCLKAAYDRLEQTKQKYEKLSSSLETKQNVVFVEGETDELYLKKAMNIFNISGFEIFWIGKKLDGKAIFGGDTALNKMKESLINNEQLIENKKVILLYDFDSNKRDENNGNLYIRSTIANTEETIFRKGIENLLTLPQEFDRSRFYENITSTDEYGGSIKKQSFNKMKLCNYLCEETEEQIQKDYFIKMKPILESLKSIFYEK